MASLSARLALPLLTAVLLSTSLPAAPPAPAPPSLSLSPAASTRRPTPPNTEIRAIYLTGLMAGSPHGKQIAERWRAEGGNAVVFDVKDATGPVSFNADLPLASHLKRPYIHNLPAWVAWLHQHGLYAIARIAVFKDERLVREHPELAVRSRSTGGVWNENGQPDWVDPSLREVQQYNIDLAGQVANAGVDEIQFDYIRFPVDGNQADARFAYQRTEPSVRRAAFITNFLYRAQQALKPTWVHISIDVYGIMGWARGVDLNATGQDVVSLAYYCDVICPMIYPSHFFGTFDGFKDPADQPEHFIQVGMERFNAITRDTGAIIRPWLQAFAWRTRTFGPNYILTQVETERAEHGGGFMLWNAGNRYQAPDTAMPIMMGGGSKYFLGGFPYPVTAAVSTASMQH